MAQSDVQGKIVPALSLAVISLTLTAHAAQSIDCKKVTPNSTGAIVCRTPSLLKADSKLVADLEIVNQTSNGNQASRRDKMNHWLQAFTIRREACGQDMACLLAVYKKQIDPLEIAIAQRRLEPGPGMGPR
jgi:uncharacterized protein